MRMTILLLGLLPIVGCGDPNWGTVSGTVSLNDQPLESGTVAFYSEENGPTAYGQIRSDGSYYLKTGTKTGLKAGKYVATVISTTKPDPDAKVEDPGKLLTPKKYSKRGKDNPLRFTVSGGGNTIDIKLKGQ